VGTLIAMIHPTGIVEAKEGYAEVKKRIDESYVSHYPFIEVTDLTRGGTIRLNYHHVIYYKANRRG
jgi:hypothetical protein